MRFPDNTHGASATVTDSAIEDRLKPKVRMFQPFCLNYVITDLSFTSIKKVRSRSNEISRNRAHLNENASMRVPI